MPCKPVAAAMISAPRGHMTPAGAERRRSRENLVVNGIGVPGTGGFAAAFAGLGLVELTIISVLGAAAWAIALAAYRSRQIGDAQEHQQDYWHECYRAIVS